jgi:hypothetical protein
MRAKLTVALLIAVAAVVALLIPWTSHADSTSAGGYEPVLDPANFTTTIDNPYFPLPVGRTLVYKGVKDGQSQVDRVTVTDRTKKVAEGIVARVVTDVATHNGKLLEKTSDWYAQDLQGNVWYLGEQTAAYENGKVDRSGSWEAGVDDAEPGLIMPASPRIPQSYRQEYSRGEAEDTAWIVGRGETITVPYGKQTNVLSTLEATRVEPGAYDLKVYARGLGIVRERALTGAPEVAELVAVNG